MRKCLKCGSVNITLMKQSLAKEKGKSLRCIDCGEEWRTEELSLQHLKYAEICMEEFKKDGSRAGHKTLKLYPNGNLFILIHVAGEIRSDCFMDDISVEKANVILKELDLLTCSTEQCSESVLADRKLTLRMRYSDNGVITFDEDCSRRALSLIMEELCQADDGLKTLLSISLEEEAKKREKKKKEKKIVYVASKAEDALYCLTARHSDAVGRFVLDGFLVQAGSRMAEEETVSCLKSVREIRAQMLSDGTAVDYVLTRDIVFKTQSRACSVMSGGLGNTDYWKPQTLIPVEIDPEDDEDIQREVYYEWRDAMIVPEGPFISGCPILEKALALTERFREYIDDSVIMNALRVAEWYDQLVIVPVDTCNDASEPDDDEFQIHPVVSEDGSTWLPILTDPRDALAFPGMEKVSKYLDTVIGEIRLNKSSCGAILSPCSASPVYVSVKILSDLSKYPKPEVHVLPVKITELPVDAVVIDPSSIGPDDMLSPETDYGDVLLADAGVMKSDHVFVAHFPKCNKGEYQKELQSFCIRILNLAETNHMTSVAFSDFLPDNDYSLEVMIRELFSSVRKWLRKGDHQLTDVYFCIGNEERYKFYNSLLIK